MTRTATEVREILKTIFGGEIEIIEEDEGRMLSIPREKADLLEGARLLNSVGLGYENKRVGRDDTRVPPMRAFWMK
ncbi:MAG: hypothetical protein IKP28_02805 [Clostridia bacterium]|nr:hypothetical protein [Clostridia bacterium]